MVLILCPRLVDLMVWHGLISRVACHLLTLCDKVVITGPDIGQIGIHVIR